MEVIEALCPMNQRPSLWCEGKCCNVTKHTFVEERQLRDKEGSTIAYEQLFKCDDCNHKRRFGYTAQGCVRHKRIAAVP